MKKQYVESAVLTVVYLICSGITVFYFNTSGTLLEFITYPAKAFIEPVVNKEFSFRTINLMLFTVYFLWSCNCVYLNLIKSTLKELKSNVIKKL